MFAAAALDFVERGVGDVDVTLLNEAPHLTEEEGEKEGADVGAVDVGIGHDDDFVVAGFFDAEGAVAGVAYTSANGGDEGADFVVVEDFVEAGFFDVEEFAADG